MFHFGKAKYTRKQQSDKLSQNDRSSIKMKTSDFFNQYILSKRDGDDQRN